MSTGLSNGSAAQVGVGATFFMSDMEEKLAKPDGKEYRSDILCKLNDELSKVADYLDKGVTADEFAQVQAWRKALESAIGVISRVKPEPVTAE